MTLEELWQQKRDEEVAQAAAHLADYTEDAKPVILAEMRRRGLPECPLVPLSVSDTPTVTPESYSLHAQGDLRDIAPPIGVIRLRLWIVCSALCVLTPFIGGIGIPEIIASIFVFSVMEGFHVLIIAFKYNISSGFLCLFVPFYASYFVFKNVKELFNNSLLTKTWAVLAIIGIVSVSGLVFKSNETATQRLLEGTYPPSAESTFTTKGCEYSVKFPSEPKYKTSFDPSIGEYTQAQYSTGSKADGFFLRAECIAAGDIRNAEINSKEFLQKHIVAYAESNGLQKPEYHYGENELGKYVHVRGFKTIDGVPVTYEAYTYVGDTSFVSLYAGGTSSSYPQNPVHSFFKSLRRTAAEAPITPGNFVNLSFPQGISVAVPRNWDLLDENLRANLRTFAEATARIAGLMYPQGVETTLVAANGYSTSNAPSATMRLTVVTGKTVSQQEVQRWTQYDLLQLGRETKQGLEVMFTKAERPQRVEWIDTRVEPHQGLSVLVQEYYRQPVGREKVFVQMYALFLGDKEVKLTLSRSAAEQIWIPILKYIKSSWKVDN